MVDFRPFRDRLEKDITDKIPEGPLGALGEGNLLGFAGFVVVESGEVITIPVPGLDRPGYKVVSHGLVETSSDGDEQVHEIVLHAYSEDVAEFVTQYNSAPSNFDFIRADTEVLKTEVIDPDGFYTTYEIKVLVDRSEVRDSIIR